MANRIAATRPRALARRRTWLGTFTIGRSLSGLALAGLLLAGCASPGTAPSALAGDQSAPPKADPAKTRATTTRRGAPSAIAVDPVIQQRRRQAIAEMLERDITYRTILDVKLTNARFAGPFEHQTRILFGPIKQETFYCASADLALPYWPLPWPRSAMIRVEKVNEVSERLDAEIRINGGEPGECGRVDYGPFPELEQLRAKRRAAMGKAD
jgi:hypothetical protein